MLRGGGHGADVEVAIGLLEKAGGRAGLQGGQRRAGGHSAHRDPRQLAEIFETHDVVISDDGVIEIHHHAPGRGQRLVETSVEEILAHDERELMPLVVAIDVINAPGRSARLAPHHADVGDGAEGNPVFQPALGEAVVATIHVSPHGGPRLAAGEQEGMIADERAVRHAGDRAVHIHDDLRPDARVGRAVGIHVRRRDEVVIRQHGAHRRGGIEGQALEVMIRMFDRGPDVLQEARIGRVVTDQMILFHPPGAIIDRVDRADGAGGLQAKSRVRNHQRFLAELVGREEEIKLVVGKNIVAINHVLALATDARVDGVVIAIPGAVVEIERPVVRPLAIDRQRVVRIHLVIDVEAHLGTVRGIAIKGAERLLVRLQAGKARVTQRCIQRLPRKREPEARALRPGRDIVGEGVVGIGDPVARGRAILGSIESIVRLQEFLARHGLPAQRHDIPADDIEALRSVLEKDAVTQVVVAEVILHERGLRAVDGNRAVERMPHHAVAEVLPHAALGDHVPVHRVTSERTLLPHAVKLHALDETPAVRHAATHAAIHHHDVPAKPRRLRRRIAFDLYIATEQSHLRAQLRRP